MRFLRRLWPYYRPRRLTVLSSLAQIGLAAGLGVLQPRLIGWMVDRVLTGGQWNWLLPGAAAIVLLAVVQGFLRFGQRYTMETVSQRVVADLRSNLYRHLQSLSFGFFDKAQTGELMSRVTADVEGLRFFLGMGVVNGLMHTGTFIGIVVAMLAMNWRLALVTLIFIPPLLVAINRFNRVSQPVYTAIQKQTARLSAVIQENIAGVRVVRAFAREEEEVAKFSVENRAFLETNLRSIRLNSFWSNLLNFLTVTGAISVLWYGGRLVMAGEISIGTLIAFNAYVANLVNPIRMFGMIVGMYNRAVAGSQRIFELLDTRSEVQDRPGAQPMAQIRGQVRFDHVSFTYDGEGERVLDDITLEVQPGQRVAVLGMTGSGKSSLINLIPRFYDPTGGRVLIDDCDVRDVTVESLRQQIAIVLQETFLFSTTLRENIAYGKPDATMGEIIAAARAAQIHDMISSLPDQYETVVGERGVGLSGGQKQRVTIARALLMNSPILILDESTSAVDVQTEHLIQAAMDRVMLDRTSFVIASRLSTVMNADIVVVLEQGRIAEIGIHAELVQQDGLYRRIYDLQLKPAEEFRAAHKGVAG